MNLFRRRKQNQLASPVSRRSPDPQRRSDNSYTQNRAFSYYAARSQSELTTGREPLQSKPPLRRLPTKFHRLRKQAGWLLLAMFGFALVVYDLQLSTVPKVVTLSSSANALFLQPTAIYRDAAHQMFAASAANRNKLTVDAARIASDLQQKFPELQDVSISLPVFGGTPVVYIKPAEPSMVLTASNGTYIIDENGRALAVATAGTNLNRLQVPTVTDQSGVKIELGKQVLPRNATAFITTVTDQFKRQKITVQSMTLPVAAGELDVYVSGQPYFVKFNIEQGGEDEALVQTGTFIATMKQLAKQGTTPATYIDVRLEGKAYYK
jgi:cell division septal protein FtsQ